MKKQFLIVLLAIASVMSAFAQAPPILRQAMTTNTASTPSFAGQFMVWNGTSWVARTNVPGIMATNIYTPTIHGVSGSLELTDGDVSITSAGDLTLVGGGDVTADAFLGNTWQVIIGVIVDGWLKVAGNFTNSTAYITNLNSTTINTATNNTGTLYVSNSVQYYSGASTIIIDCTFDKTHTVSNFNANTSFIVSNYSTASGTAGRGFSLYLLPVNNATNYAPTLTLSGAGAIRWANTTTNMTVVSNGWKFVSGLVTLDAVGIGTNLVVNGLDE